MEIIKTSFYQKSYIFFNFPITRWCNYNCSYCNAGNLPDSNAYLKEYDPIINKLHQVPNEFRICLTGGEPTYHPNFIDLIQKILNIPNLVSIKLFTNLSKTVEFYEELLKLQNSNKIDLIMSYHPEYHNDKMFNKILRLDKIYADFCVNVMIHDREKYWDVQENMLQFVKDNGIEYTPVFIRSTGKHLICYTNKFKSRFKKYFVESDIYEYLDVEYSDGSRGKLKTDDLLFDNASFKGFNCEAKTYSIMPSGQIVNTCTNKPIPDIIPSDYFTTMKVCPQDVCPSTLMLEYTKERIK